MKKAQVAYFDSEINAIKATLKVLLPNVDAATYSVAQNQQTRHITIPAVDSVLEAVSKQLEQALDSPEAIRATLNYHLSGSTVVASQSASVSSVIAEYPTQPEESVASGIQWLNRLFPKKLGKGIYFVPEEFFAENEGAHSKEGVLFSTETDDPDVKGLWELCSRRMLALFNDVPVSEIRALWEGKTKPENKVIEKLQPNAVATGLLLECFGTVDNADTNTKRIYFNYMKLFQLLYPPKIVTHSEGYLMINTEHMVTYMKQCVREGFLLSIDNRGLTAEPLFFEVNKTITAPLDLLFILDVSDSMKGSESDYFKTITVLLDKVRLALGEEKSKKAKVTFELFGSKIDDLKYFNLNNEREIAGFLQSIWCNGGATALYKAVYDGLAHSQKLAGKNNVVILLTDGFNTSSEEYEMRMHDRMKVVRSNANLQLSLFTLGLGGSVDTAVLENLALSTASHYFPITRLSEFTARIEEHMNRLQYSHQLYQLLFDNKEFSIPVPKNGSFSKAQVQIPLTNGKVDLQINGDKYWVSVQAVKAAQLSSDALAGMVRSRSQLSNQSQSNSDDDDNTHEMDANRVTAGIS